MVTLMVIAVLSLLGAAFLTTSATEIQIAAAQRAHTQALYLAEGGIHSALSELNRSLPVTGNGTLGPGEYAVQVITAGVLPGQRRIEATGHVPTQAAPRAVRQVAVLVVRPSPFQWGAFGRDSLDVGGSGVTDSFDSALGPYGGTNVGADGDVGSNGLIHLGGSAIVNGDATTGLGTIDVGGGRTPEEAITGDITMNAPPVTLDPIVLPTTNDNGNLPSSVYDSATGAFTLPGSMGTYTLPAGTYVFSSLDLSGGSILNIDGKVTIYLTGPFDGGGGGGINNVTQDPTQFTLYSTYDGAATAGEAVGLSGNSTFYGAIYAPNGQVKLGGGSQVFGSIVAASVDVSGQGDTRFHFDQALSRIAGASGKFAVVPKSWTEF